MYEYMHRGHLRVVYTYMQCEQCDYSIIIRVYCIRCIRDTVCLYAYDDVTYVSDDVTYVLQTTCIQCVYTRKQCVDTRILCVDTNIHTLVT